MLGFSEHSTIARHFHKARGGLIMTGSFRVAELSDCRIRPWFRRIGASSMIVRHDDICCPLCSCKDSTLFFKDKKRTYQRCVSCRLVFVPKRFWIAIEEERATYDLHENDANDRGYRRFLSRLSIPLLERLDKQQSGLDFGCGPGPTLSILLEEEGHSVDLYDPFYFNNSSVFNKKYDFICATEVVEHLHDPNREFTCLFNMLKRGGWLGITTKLVIDEACFRRWHYIRDMTHICFYCHDTFEYLSRRFNAAIEFVASDVILFNKQ
jgi:hypothetical protein